MKTRTGFVSNSSSCSFILILPEDEKVLTQKRAFMEYFGIKNMTQEESEKLRKAVNDTIEEDKKISSLLESNYKLLVSYLGDLAGQDGWLKYNAEDPRDYSYSMEDYKRYKKDMEELLYLLKAFGNRLLFLEIGDSCEFTDSAIPCGSSLGEDLSLESRATEMITKNCYIFNNR